MSGIAEVLITLGYKITGSDLKRSPTTTRLSKKGAKIFYGHREANVQGAHVVVISSAVKPTNPEWQEAHRLNIPVIPRAEMLAELMRMKYGIAVAGSHGKTTTTSLVSNVLYRAGLDPTLVIGGRVKSFRSNAKLGKGEFLVAEADESDGSFLKLSPTIAILTNIDPEHLDHYQSFDELKTTFVQFANKVPFYGSVIACADHLTIQEILPRIGKRVVTYGLTEAADFYARSIEQQGLQVRFEVFHLGRKLGSVRLKLAGLHNVYNALAAIAAGVELDIPFKKIASGLESFKGIERRMEPLYKGEVTVIDDYGHHPEEIKATLSALRLAFPTRRIITLFQPHRYSRTRDLFEDFQTAFGNTDLLLMADIYAAGEDPIEGVSAQGLVQAMCENFKNASVRFVGNQDKILEETLSLIKPQDIVLTLGAGDIVKVGKKLSQKLKNKHAH